eukprot:653352-Amphidinium_carterae.1
MMDSRRYKTKRWCQDRCCCCSYPFTLEPSVLTLRKSLTGDRHLLFDHVAAIHHVQHTNIFVFHVLHS